MNEKKTKEKKNRGLASQFFYPQIAESGWIFFLFGQMIVYFPSDA